MSHAEPRAASSSSWAVVRVPLTSLDRDQAAEDQHQNNTRWRGRPAITKHGGRSADVDPSADHSITPATETGADAVQSTSPISVQSTVSWISRCTLHVEVWLSSRETASSKKARGWPERCSRAWLDDSLMCIPRKRLHARSSSVQSATACPTNRSAMIGSLPI